MRAKLTDLPAMRLREDPRDRETKASALRRLRSYQALLSPQTRNKDPLLGKLRNEREQVTEAFFEEVPRAVLARLLGLAARRGYSRLIGFQRLPFSDSLKEELYWLSSTLVSFAEPVRAFLRYRTQFECALLRGETALATSTLETVRHELGASLWTLQNELLLADQRGGLAANRDMLRSVRNSSKSSLLRLFADFYSQRAEAELSHINYDIAVESFIAQYKGRADIQKTLREIRFRIHLASFKGVAEIPYILWRSSALPITDQYESCVTLLQALAVRQPSERKSLARTINKLARLFDDVRLESLRQLVTPSGIDERYISGGLLTALDAYTTGDNARCLELAERGLQDQPHWLEHYLLYARATISAGRSFVPAARGNSLQAAILEDVYQALSRESNSPSAISRIRSLACRLQGHHLGSQLLHFAEGLSSTSSDVRLHEALTSSTLTPRLSLHMDDSDARIYLRELAVKCANSATVSFFCATRALPGSSLPTMPELRWRNYSARSLLGKGQFDEAIKEWREILLTPGVNVLLRQDAVEGLYDAYLKTSRLNECLSMVVSVFLDQPNLLTPVRIDALAAAERNSGRTNEEHDPVGWAIAYHLDNSRSSKLRDTTELSNLVELVLMRAGATRPSELATSSATAKDIFFLRHVCTPDVLDHSVEYSNTEELLNERVAICQRLSALDAKGTELYSQEIFQLDQFTQLRRALQHLAETKVSQDIRGLRDSFDISFRQRYERFENFSRLSERQRQSLKLHDLDLTRDIVLLTDAGQEQFKELFAKIKARFLYSDEYGLDSCLSVRIRHGTLAGQLRSRFENANLVTRKSGRDQRYDRNVYWSEETLDVFGAEKEAAVDLRLQQFSLEIDTIILEVKDSRIQIKGPSNADCGLFDYNFSEVELLALYASALVKAPSYEEFLTFCLNELTERTQKNLRNVVGFIKGDLTQRLMGALEALATDIVAIDTRIRSTALVEAIRHCRTQVQNDLEAIAAWFQLPTDELLDNFSASLLIETAIATVRRCFPIFMFEPLLKIEPLTFKGDTLVALEDAIFLLLSNIVQHSRASNPTIEISIWIDSSRVNIEIKNSLSSEVDDLELSKTISQLNSTSENLGAISSRTSREGGTGYVKLHKILRYDLACQLNYDVHVSLESPRTFCARVTVPRERVLA